MHLSLFGMYWYGSARGFYIGKVGDERLDSSLIGVHWGLDVDTKESMEYRTLSFDILYLTLIRQTFIDIFGCDEDEEGGGSNGGI